MKKYDMEINEKNLLDSIQKDYLGRNKKLSKLMDLLNSVNGNIVISIDGNWGTGKTIFVKQLEIVNKSDTIEILDKDVVDKFKNNYITFYYNAWENDMHDSALLSLIYNLIDAYPKEKKQTANGKVQLPFNLKELLKSISGNSIDLDKVTSFEDISKEIYTIEEKREALNKILENIIPKDKKLLFIVDELDRCKPSFAVNLLEILKHFFNNKRIVFIVSTNNEQLSHTINNYYGNNFDGYGYLNKFYDLIIELEEVDFVDYLSNVFKINKEGRYSSYSMFAVISYFKFNMREINRLLSDYDLLSSYFTTVYGFYDEDNIIKYVFLPYCLGLKIYNRESLSQFLKGYGLNSIIKFIEQEEKMKRIVEKEIKRKNEQKEVSDDDIINLITEEYNSYFINTENKKYSDTYLNKQTFIDTFSLLGDYVKFN